MNIKYINLELLYRGYKDEDDLLNKIIFRCKGEIQFSSRYSLFSLSLMEAYEIYGSDMSGAIRYKFSVEDEPFIGGIEIIQWLPFIEDEASFISRKHIVVSMLTSPITSYREAALSVIENYCDDDIYTVGDIVRASLVEKNPILKEKMQELSTRLLAESELEYN